MDSMRSSTNILQSETTITGENQKQNKTKQILKREEIVLKAYNK